MDLDLAALTLAQRARCAAAILALAAGLIVRFFGSEGALTLVCLAALVLAQRARCAAAILARAAGLMVRFFSSGALTAAGGAALTAAGGAAVSVGEKTCCNSCSRAWICSRIEMAFLSCSMVKLLNVMFIASLIKER